MDGALGALAQVRLELGEGLPDRAEVEAVERKEEQPGARRLDGVARGGRLWLDRLSMMTMSPG